MPRTREHSRPCARVFSRLFPRVPGRSRTMNVSGRQVHLAFLCGFGVSAVFRGPKSRALPAAPVKQH